MLVVALDDDCNKRLSTISRRLQINFRFSRAPCSLRKRQVAFERNFKGIRSMNLSDLYILFNYVRAKRSADGASPRDENFI